MSEISLVLTRAKCGCHGCYYYEHNSDCPVDEAIMKHVGEEDIIKKIRSIVTESECVQNDAIWVEGDKQDGKLDVGQDAERV